MRRKKEERVPRVQGEERVDSREQLQRSLRVGLRRSAIETLGRFVQQTTHR